MLFSIDTTNDEHLCNIFMMESSSILTSSIPASLCTNLGFPAVLHQLWNCVQRTFVASAAPDMLAKYWAMETSSEKVSSARVYASLLR